MTRRARSTSTRRRSRASPTRSPSTARLPSSTFASTSSPRRSRSLTTGLSFAKEGDKSLFAVHSLLGDIYDRKHDLAKAVSEYEAAKKACGQCNEAGQQIAFFNLGAAYASLKPPRKSEAMAQLQSFQKMICKGAAAQRYADQCTQAQQLASKLGGTLQ